MAWYDTLEDGERAAAVAKGWDKFDGDAAAQRIFNSYRALERMPRPEAPPATAEGYKFDGIKEKDGTDPDADFLGFARSLAFDLGLPASKAPVLADKLLRYGDAAEDITARDAQARIETGTAALKSGWGTDYEKNLDVAGRAFEKLGLPKEMTDALVERVGIDKVMGLGLELGQKMGEASFIKGDNIGQREQPMDRNSALQERNRLMGDADFAKKIVDGDKEALAKIEQLSKDILGDPTNWQAPPENFGRFRQDQYGAEGFNPGLTPVGSTTQR